MIKRPDGARRLTVDGKPLYTFSEDSPGKATDDGFTDDFGGHHFTWHVIRANGATASGAGSGSGRSTPNGPGGSGSGRSTPNGTGGSGGGYSY